MSKNLKQYFEEIGCPLPYGSTLHYQSSNCDWRAKTDSQEWILSNDYNINWEWLENKSVRGINFGPDLSELPLKFGFMFIPLDLTARRTSLDGWLPIISAPKNGDFILGVEDDEYKLPHIINWNGSHWEDSYAIDGYGDYVHRNPKWWMLLPNTERLR